MKNRDKDIVQAILQGDKEAERYLLVDLCNSMLSYIVFHVFNGKADKDELVSELYLYISENNWEKLHKFQFKCKLTTWLSIVATRYFIKKRDALIENDSQESLIEQNERNRGGYNPSSYVDRRMDVRSAILMMRNERYRMVITELDLKDRKPEELAIQMEVTVDNLYNIHKRAYVQLGMIIKRNGGYYD